MDSADFTVTLHHLRADAKQAGAQFPDAELPAVNAKKLRALIRAFAGLADGDLDGAAPELRIAAPHGQFVVLIAQGRLRINSWTMRVGGTDLSPDQIFSLITGAEAVADAAGLELGPARRRPRALLLAVMAVVVIGTNATTAWMLMRSPPPPLLPEYVPLARQPGERLLGELAGEYRTGDAGGGRALVIHADGHAHWSTYGPGRTVVEESDIELAPVRSHGRPALLADERALIERVDAATITFYNETYRRVVP